MEQGGGNGIFVSRETRMPTARSNLIKHAIEKDETDEI